MAEANPSGEPDVNPQGSGDPSGEPNSNDNGYSNQPQGPSDAERKLQSERDKLRDRVDQLEGFALESMRDKAVSSFLKENGDKYPDADADDFLTASTDEDFENLAKKAQDKADRIRNKALADVQNVPDDSLTPEQAQAELDKLEEKPDPQGFQKYLNVLQRTKR